MLPHFDKENSSFSSAILTKDKVCKFIEFMLKKLDDEWIDINDNWLRVDHGPLEQAQHPQGHGDSLARSEDQRNWDRRNQRNWDFNPNPA